MKTATPKRYGIKDRKSKVSIDDLARPHKRGDSFAKFVVGLPNQLAAVEFRDAVSAIVTARKKGRPVILGFGGHVIKVGLGALIVDLMENGVVTGVCSNGAGMIHDFELAVAGKTSEDVDEALGDGSFGFAVETGSVINEAVKEAARKKTGIGASIGRWMNSCKAKNRKKSVFASAERLGVPATVHVAIGTDITHVHPEADGASWGAAAMRDFEIFCGMVERLEGGVYINMGSAVILPEIFLKAVTRARNIGRPLAKITTIDMDFIRQYRPLTNVVRRPTMKGGRGISLTGCHEIMGPLLFAAVVEEMRGGVLK